ncbi:hypothetical protein [Psychroflexus sp. MES1-P1E]|uniref:hypothetical protein n=1 Tax=Psychroflexus sp. MES1-P1E TaxID=2058320 RepID=UPI000C7D5110|nr:hypothetical protein [Psychroflexus sp. MES1-P1E]PKG42784.1 hypothetical protein CXF67_08470 [Psychroflexus sp. MES1-P1E]
MCTNLNLESRLYSQDKTIVVYFSHSKSTYGTENEKLILDFLKNEFKIEVICPNNDLGDLMYPPNYAHVASEADVLFVWGEYNDGQLSKGCFDELEASIHKGKELYLLEVHGSILHIRWISNIDKNKDFDFFDYGYATSAELKKFELK